MPGALRRGQGGALVGGRLGGDPPVGSDRARRRLIAKQVEKALAAHPCGTCDACCTVMQVEAIGKAEGVPCPALKAQKGQGASGCSCYAKRPDSCKTFNCVWRVGLLDQTSKPDIEGRPDKLGIMFDVNDTHATGIQLLVAREVWKGAIDAAMPLLHELAGQGHVLYLIDGDRRRMMGPEERVKAVQEAARRRLPLAAQ